MTSVTALWQGIRLGLMLQLAVGPVCLFALNASFSVGFVRTLPFVLAVTLADALYVALSVIGIASFLNKPRARKLAGAIGGVTLILLGVNMALGALGVLLIPGLRFFQPGEHSNLFVQGLLLTLSNPLTILFWSGVLTARIAKTDLTRRELYAFASGCVLAAAFFLTAITAVGGILDGHMPVAVARGLNIAVGVALAAFGVRLLLKKPNANQRLEPAP